MQLSSNGNNGRSNEAIRHRLTSIFCQNPSQNIVENRLSNLLLLSRIKVLNDKCVMLKEQKFENIDH